jgi:NAD kinase
MFEASGEGYAFSTPLGSTGQGYSNGGAIIGLDIPCIIATGIGLGRPRGVPAYVAAGQNGFIAECIVSKGKRPLRIDFDGNSIRPDINNPAQTVEIGLKAKPTAILGVRPGSFHPFKRLELP